MVGQDHGVDLDGLQLVRVVAEDARQFGATQLRQLLWRKGGRPARVLVPEAVADTQVVELTPNDAGKDRTDQRT